MGLRDTANEFKRWLLRCSLMAANRERGEEGLKKKLCAIVPDISRKFSYSTIAQDDLYSFEKTRCQHCFQVSLALKAADMLRGRGELTVADIGDASGIHLAYLKELLREKGVEARTVSVNLDPVAVEKVRARGMEAVCCRAEELADKHNIKADIFLSYEMLEHLFDPISFLRSMREKSACEYFVITVPYMRRSRVGLHQLRHGIEGEGMNAENTHVFELCPEDLKLIFRFSGWDVVYKETCRQYPSRGLLRLLAPLWRRLDFEGFHGVILRKGSDSSYKDWKS